VTSPRQSSARGEDERDAGEDGDSSDGDDDGDDAFRCDRAIRRG
jgi:hypothetical protein